MYNGVGAPNGPGARPFDRWFRYPAGFAAATLNLCFESSRIPRSALVVDPFAGANTTGVKSCEMDLPFIGIEAHPLIAELAALKLLRPSSPENLIAVAQELVNEDRRSDPLLEHQLVARSFQPATLSRLAGLRDSIRESDENPWLLHLKWALLGALRDCASVSVGWPYQRPGTARVPRVIDPYKAFIRRATWMSEDLTAATDVPMIARVHEGDARDTHCWDVALAGRRAGAVITSPPYLNNFDYADATRLELYFWKVVESWKQMTTHVRSGMVVATTQQSRKQLAVEASEKLAQLCPETHGFVHGLIASLQRERASRARGKEYDQLLPSYFVDLALVMIRIRQSTVPGAPVALVLGDSAPYGVYVDTPALIVSAAQELGFSHETTQILRRRGLRWHTNGRRHSVSLSEKLVLLRSPNAQ